MKNILVNLFVVLSLVIIAPGTPAMAQANNQVYVIDSFATLVSVIKRLEKDRMEGKALAATVVVAQGPVVKHFTSVPGVGAPVKQLAELQKVGVSFEVCTYSILDQRLSTEVLLPGVRHLDEGGPARVKELKSEGYTVIE